MWIRQRQRAVAKPRGGSVIPALTWAADSEDVKAPSMQPLQAWLPVGLVDYKRRLRQAKDRFVARSGARETPSSV
jgi:hypothetical protein